MLSWLSKSQFVDVDICGVHQGANPTPDHCDPKTSYMFTPFRHQSVIPQTSRPSLDAFDCIASVCEDTQVLAPVLESWAMCWLIDS